MSPIIVYMEALTKAAAEMKETIPVSKDMMKIKSCMDDPAWWDSTGRPLFQKEHPPKENIQLYQAGDLIKELALESTVVPKYLAFLAKKNRLPSLRKISVEYVKEIYDTQGIIPATVTSAQALDDASIDRIKNTLKEQLGASDIKLVTKVSDKLIAGYILEYDYLHPGDMKGPRGRVDYSLASRLEQATKGSGLDM